MSTNHPKYAEWVNTRPPVNPLLWEMFKKMSAGGHLDGLSGDDAMSKVSKAIRSFADEDEYTHGYRNRANPKNTS